MKNRPGRPRDEALDVAIADAVVEVLLESGYGAVTVERVAARAGTTRTAVYRRFRGRADLVIGVLVGRFGLDPAPDTGSLRGDLEGLQRQLAAFFTHPLMGAAITGLLADVRADDRLGERFHQAFVAPRRRSTSAMLHRAVQRGEIGPVHDERVVHDLLSGPLLIRTVLPGIGPVDDGLVAATVLAVLALVGAPITDQPRR